MKDQIALFAFLWERETATALKDRYSFLKENHGLNTPAMAAELVAIKSILKGRTKRPQRNAHKHAGQYSGLNDKSRTFVRAEGGA